MKYLTTPLSVVKYLKDCFAFARKNINLLIRSTIQPFNFSTALAFTLAEVLITLGIIGVIAAMTIPSLIQENKKSVIETRLASFYSTMNQAIKLSEIDNGDKMTWPVVGSTTTEIKDWFNKYLEPYIKYSKVDTTTANNKIYIYLLDGSMMKLNTGSIMYWPLAKDAKDFINSGDSSFVGTKCFAFGFFPNYVSVPYASYVYHYNKGVEPYKYNWDGVRDSLLTDDNFGCKKSQPIYQRAYCTALIQINSWKIPEDYPLNF